MQTVHKAVATVIRSAQPQPAENKELLVFKHPSGTLQMPKGTVEEGEAISDAVLRELKEESGLTTQIRPRIIGTWDRVVGGGPKEDGPLEINRWHIGLLHLNANIDDHWSHIAEGSPAEDGLLFEFSWQPLNDGLPDALDPVFSTPAQMILTHLKVCHPPNNLGQDI